MRRTLRVAAVAAAMLAASAANAQLKIGFVATMSGPGGAGGQDQYDGFMLGVEQMGGKLGNVPVQVLREDDQLKPEVGVQVVDKLLNKERTPIITGITFSNVMMAVYRPIVDAQVFLIGSNAGPSPIAGAQCSPFFFSTAWQNDQPHEVGGKYATDRGYKRAFILAPNYQAGKDALTGFKRYYKGEIVDEVYTQVNQPDYSAEIAQIQAKKPDAVYVFYPGGMGVNFVKQYSQAGLMKQIPLISAFTADGTTLPALKDTAVGLISGAYWGPGLDNPLSRKFVADFEKKHGRIPSAYAAQGYDAALLLDSALKKTGGKVDDRKAFQAALRAADFKSIRGDFSFNTNGYPIQDFYAFEVTKDASGRIDLTPRQKAFEHHRDAYWQSCPLK
jgi:branched-chain amino acid transport system substrate-binding protein